MSRLFDDFLARDPGVLGFYAGDWGDVDAWRASAERALGYAGPRLQTVEVLRTINADWLTPEASGRLEAVASGGGVAVVGGQQAGLLTGPLYTINKAVTLLKYADWAEEMLGIPTLPVFWVASNDSDLVEAGTVSLVDRAHALQTFTFHDREAAAPYRGWPVGRIPLGDGAAALASWLAEHLPESDFLSGYMEAVRSACRPEATLAEAFIRLMGTWLGPHGLVLLEPLHPGFQGLAGPLFERVLADPHAAGASLEAVGAALKTAGYHQQLHMPPNRLPLFATREGEERRPLIPTDSGDRVLVEGAGEFAVSELLDPEGPWTVDPNAALRPLLQDHLLPTAAFVGGPSEIAYFAQLKDLYGALGIPWAIAVPRARGMLLPRVAQRVLDKYDLGPADLAEGPDAAARRIVAARFPEDLEQAFNDTTAGVRDAVAALQKQVIAFDPTLEKPFETAAGRMESELGKLRGKAISNQSRQLETLHQQIEKAAVWLYPEGDPQERRLNLAPFAARHSAEGVIALLLEHLDPTAPERIQLIPFDSD